MKSLLDLVDQLSLSLSVGCLGRLLSVASMVEYMADVTYVGQGCRSGGICRNRDIVKGYCLLHSTVVGVGCRIAVRSQKGAIFDAVWLSTAAYAGTDVEVVDSEVIVSYAVSGECS
jgi:hypothetical protein